MHLAYWSSVWFDGEFNPTSGTVVRRHLQTKRSDTQSYPGYFETERPLFSSRVVLALYLEAGTMYFQAGTRRWPLDQPELSFRFDVLRPGLLSRFKVVESGNTTFSITYLHLIRTLYANIDPTYDLLEFENDHFLSFVASTTLSPEWQSNVHANWAV